MSTEPKEPWKSPVFHMTHRETGEQIECRFLLYKDDVDLQVIGTKAQLDDIERKSNE